MFHYGASIKMRVMQEAINTCPDSRLQEHLKCIRPNYLLQYVSTEQSTDTDASETHKHPAQIDEQEAEQTAMKTWWRVKEIKILAAAGANHSALFTQFHLAQCVKYESGTHARIQLIQLLFKSTSCSLQLGSLHTVSCVIAMGGLSDMSPVGYRRSLWSTSLLELNFTKSREWNAVLT